MTMANSVRTTEHEHPKTAEFVIVVRNYQSGEPRILSSGMTVPDAFPCRYHSQTTTTDVQFGLMQQTCHQNSGYF
ncbi:hypothetical protein KIN20_001120 [Parelaphostrongylus tenuis]|uniref:Uncharacterized protein n=1 Tax=Parelaphostrongylus tenuis TaxID=148309 RepID=A0AAD5LVQ3_PARTN|nr:hypothetical protein KIN20_001120 [Parelaphostrongylus tenuis]